MNKKYKDGAHILSVKPFSLINISKDVYDDILCKLNDVAKTFTKSYILRKSIMIENLIKYNVDGSWVVRLNESEQYGRDSSSLNSLVCRYGNDVGTMLFNEKLKKSTITEQTYIDKYGEVEGRIKWNELCKSKASFTEKHYTDKYGEEVGERLWKDVVNRKVKSWTNNIKNGKFKCYLTLDEYQDKYGVEAGYIRWKRREVKRQYYSSLQYYIDTYGEEAGTIICSNVKNNTTLDRFIDRYGEELGKIRYEQNCKQCAITLPKMIQKYGEVEGKLRYRDWKEKVVSAITKIGVSKSSQDLFWCIYEKLDKSLQELVYFYELNNEYKFYHHIDNTIKLYRVDFKLGNKIIEFDCDYWHDADKDKIRDEFLMSKGYDVLRVNYTDYKKNKTELISKCIGYLYE